MRYEKNRKVFGMDELQFMKLLRFLILPLIVLILIVVIVIADLPDKKEENPEASAQETAAGETAETVEETSAPYDYANADPQRCTDDEINDLVSRYLDARASGDADTVAEIFSITDEEELETLKTQLDEERKLYDSFENTVNYVIPGVEEDSWIVYISTEGWFKKVETPAPMLFRTYIARGDDGSLHMKEDSALNEEEAAAVKAADSSEKVTAMNQQQRTELAKAVVSDARLGSLYERLKVGGSEPETAPASTEAESVSEAVVEVGGETAESTESGAAGTGESGSETAEAGEAGSEGAESGAAEPGSAESGSAGSEGTESESAESGNAESGNADSTEAESGAAESGSAESAETEPQSEAAET